MDEAAHGFIEVYDPVRRLNVIRFVAGPEPSAVERARAEQRRQEAIQTVRETLEGQRCQHQSAIKGRCKIQNDSVLKRANGLFLCAIHARPRSNRPREEW